MQVPGDWLPSSQFLGWLGWLGDHGIILQVEVESDINEFRGSCLSVAKGLDHNRSQLRKHMIYAVCRCTMVCKMNVLFLFFVFVRKGILLRFQVLSCIFEAKGTRSVQRLPPTGNGCLLWKWFTGDPPKTCMVLMLALVQC